MFIVWSLFLVSLTLIDTPNNGQYRKASHIVIKSDRNTGICSRLDHFDNLKLIWIVLEVK